MSDCRFGVSPVNYPDPDKLKFKKKKKKKKNGFFLFIRRIIFAITDIYG